MFNQSDVQKGEMEGCEEKVRVDEGQILLQTRFCGETQSLEFGSEFVLHVCIQICGPAQNSAKQHASTLPCNVCLEREREVLNLKCSCFSNVQLRKQTVILSS